MRPASSVLAIALATTVSGCSGSYPLGPVSPQFVAGKWGESFDFPGSSFSMDLVISGSTVTGTGGGCGEAGPCSVTTITGTSDLTGVHLDMRDSTTLPQAGAITLSHFTGRLVSPNTLKGTTYSDGQPDPNARYAITFNRVSN